MQFRPPIRGVALTGLLTRAKQFRPRRADVDRASADPEHELVRLVADGAITGDVLEVGCGHGANVLYLADHGYHVWGIDESRRAISTARAAARQRDLDVTVLVWSSAALARLGRQFDTVLDFGHFRTYGPRERVRYASGLHAVTKPGGRCHLLCVSEHDDSNRGVAADDIVSTFAHGWTVETIHDTIIEGDGDHPRQAYLVTLVRRPPDPDWLEASPY
jgi:SAM-dependent methyltransferase